MSQTQGDGSAVRRVLVATDRSETADRAVRWAATLAAAHDAELLLLQVLRDGGPSGEGPDGRVEAVESDLRHFARELAGPRGRARVVVDDDPSRAILDAISADAVDVVVVGNVGMRGRKEFLLGNIPNRISHNARCSVVIVNTAPPDGQARATPRRDQSALPPTEGQVLRRALRIGRVLAKVGTGAVRSRSREGGGEERTRAAAKQLRDALDELGPTFAKLGQILSTRPDLLPSAVVDELATLQERVTPLTEAEVVAAMERELGVPWEDVFASIDPTAFDTLVWTTLIAGNGPRRQVDRVTLST